MNATSIGFLVGVQPLTNVFQGMAYRIQSESKESVKGEIQSTIHQLKSFWYPKKRDPDRVRYYPLIGGGALYVLAWQFLEVSLFQALTYRANMHFIPSHVQKIETVRVYNANRPSSLVQRPGPPPPPHTMTSFLKMLLIKTSVYPIVALFSHPFSMLRMVWMVTSDLPEDSFTDNLAYASPSFLWERAADIGQGRYERSIMSHIFTGWASIWVGDIALHFILKYYGRHNEAAINRQRSGLQPKVSLEWLHGLIYDHLLRLLAGFITKLITYPVGVIQTKLEIQGAGVGYPLRYDGWVDCVKKTYNEEGIPGMYRGLGASTLLFAAQGLWIGLMYCVARGIIKYELYDDTEDDSRYSVV